MDTEVRHETDTRLRDLEASSCEFKEKFVNISDRLSKLETRTEVHDSDINGVKTKLDLFYQEWKIYTETQAERRNSKRWGIEQTIAVIALLIAIGTAFAAPAYVITKLAPQAVERVE